MYYSRRWIFIFLFFVQISFGQKIEYIGLKEGLSSGFVYDFIQSTDGFIYIGLNSGLNRYDGYEVKHYKHDPFDPYSISSSAVNNIREDKRGYIWVAMESGALDVFNPSTGRFHHLGYFGKQSHKYHKVCLLYTSPSPRDQRGSRMPSSA